MPVARAKAARIQGNAPIARSLLRPLLRGYEAVHLKMQRRQAALAERVERYAFMEMHTEDIVMRLDAKGIVKHVSHSVQPRELMHVNYVRNVESVLKDTGVSPSSIVLEVTETAVMEDIDKAQATLNHLRSLGFRLALDDFGTGYSSISMPRPCPSTS